jgi:Zn-dependent protease
MYDNLTAPPVIDPPPMPPPVMPEPPPPKPASPWQKAWGGLLAIIAAGWKYAYIVFKLAQGGKILLTAGTMLASIWFYSLLFGWKLAVGFVICIFVHEMGHVFVAWTQGIPVSAPIFIPGMGALILQKRSGGSAWRNALIGIGGPLFGGLASAACYGFYLATDNKLFLALAFIGFLMNLFNMIPMYPLDGGWITGAVSPYIWIAGLAMLLAMAVTGRLHNPFIYLLIIMSLPRLVDVFKRRTMDAPGQRTTPAQKVAMGIAYVGLCAFLAGGVAISALEQNPPPAPRTIETPDRTVV